MPTQRTYEWNSQAIREATERIATDFGPYMPKWEMDRLVSRIQRFMISIALEKEIQIMELERQVAGYIDQEQTIAGALNIAYSDGQIDGDHHKTWVIDQMVRVLLGSDEAYQRWVQNFEYGEDGEKTYEWEEGIAP